MFGNKWELASGRVAEALGDQGAGPVYDVEVYRAKGGSLRGHVTALAGMAELAAGARIQVEVNHKTSEMRFSPEHVQMKPISGPYQPGGFTGTHVTSSTTIQFGDDAPVEVAGGVDATALLQSLMGGHADRGDRKAAISQLRAMAEQAKAARAAGGGAAAQLPDEAAQIFGASTGLGAVAEVLRVAAQNIAQTQNQGGPVAPSGPVGPYSQGQGTGPVGPYSAGQPADPYNADPGPFSSPADVFGTGPQPGSLPGSEATDLPQQNWVEQQQNWLGQQGGSDEDQPREQF